MKYCFLLLGLVLLGTSCDKEDDPQGPDPAIHFATAKVNGIDWKSTQAFYSATPQVNDFTTVFFSTSNEAGILRQQIRFKFLNFPLQDTALLTFVRRGSVDNLRPTAYVDTFVADGDATAEGYDILDNEDYSSWLHIDSQTQEELRGTFELHFLISPDTPAKADPAAPDTLHFTNGAFEAKFIE